MASRIIINPVVGPSGSGDEKVGLILAVALHAAVLAALLFTPRAAPPKVPDRIAVTLSDDVGLTSTSPEPAARAAADVAPTIGEAQPAPAEPVPVPPEPVRQAAPPPPLPQPVARPQPRTPPPKPVPAARPAPPTPSKKITATSSPARQAAPAAPSPKRAGGQRIGADFLKGLGADPGTSKSSPAAAIGPGVTASLAGAISRQLKPNWNAPDGVDIDKLATTIEWDLNSDGTLAGAPRFVSQTGVTGSNRAQAQRHIEQAMRAVRQSAPYPLPAKYYAAWKRVRFTFDWKLDQ